MNVSSRDFPEDSSPFVEDDLVSSAYSTIPDKFEDISTQKSFQPWHLPRKHYCRLKQWSFHTQKLQRELKISSPAQERPLRYLTLPGDELLDIRQLAKVMQKEGIRMQFLGFNTASDKLRSAEADLSFSEVRQMEGILEKPSEILQYRIETITEEKSLARRKVMEHLPFDVINLDFTGSMVGQPPLSNSSYFQVVQWLMEQQCNKNRKPWLLFLTVPLARDGRTNNETAKHLWKCVYDNAQQKGFADTLYSLLQISKGELLGEMDGFAQLDDHRYSLGLGLALSKWMLRLLTARPDLWTVKLVDAKSYRVHTDFPEMYSMTFKFLPHDISTVDSVGLTVSLTPPMQGMSELEAGLELIQSISQTEDVDKLLDGDRELLAEAIALSAELLATARYDANEYRAWALQHMQTRRLLDMG